MNKTFKLNTNFDIPLIGFGTYKVHGSDLIYKTLDSALNAGYRLIGKKRERRLLELFVIRKFLQTLQ